jgi:molybdopterin molybdotransferase
MSKHREGDLMPVGEALRIVLEHVRPLPAEVVSLRDALHSTLAADALADADQPAFDRAAMDGIAVRSQDCRQSGTLLRSIGEAVAGRSFVGEVAAGTCVRTMTGAIVPAGADAVVPFEKVLRESEGSDGEALWRLPSPVHAEANVARKGSEVHQGEAVVSAGTVLDGPRMGALAAFGHAQVTVHRRPEVALLPTGNELVGVEQTPGPGQVRDSNRWALAGLLQAAGAHVRHGEAVPDRPQALREALEHALAEADVVVLSGGVSAGDYDLVAAALREVGATALVHRVAIKPGKPFLFAVKGDKLIFGLPGNPVSAAVCAVLFLLPALAKLQGETSPAWRLMPVAAGHAVGAGGPRTEILPFRLVFSPSGAEAHLVRTAGSADLTHFATADAWVMRPPSAPEVLSGGALAMLWWPRP